MGETTAVSTTLDLDQPAPRDWSESQGEALRLWIALARCYSSFAKAVSVKIHEYGLTTPQFGVLEALYHLGPLSLGELAEKLLVTGGNVTYVMDRLEQQDLVYRERSEDDRRVIQAKLTAEGRALIESVFQGHAEYIEHLTRHVETDERAELKELLKKLGKGVALEDL
jgi:MarR family 2-MHQ and catechol resistance regulon transcriptional repressor